MEKKHIDLTYNPLVKFLNKPPADFTRSDIINYILKNRIEMLNFRYVDGNGRLKTLNFILTSKEQLERILSIGERVDGSSLFPNIKVYSSDLYVVPKYRTAFLNPFSKIPAMDILCSYFTKNGELLHSSPENIIRKASEVIKKYTGFTFEAMGELEYYVISDKQKLFPIEPQKGYHQSAPFTKWEELRLEAMQAIARCGCKIKYAHSEVGNICADGKDMEQHEIEFEPVPVEDAADQITIARWITRMIGYRYSVMISFAPKISLGHAGSGLHIHTRLKKGSKNIMLTGNRLSEVARKTIAGYLSLAPSLTAFGNTNPLSYFRLVPGQEAPTNIFWADGNRSGLVRVPLGWTNTKDMSVDVNPKENKSYAEPVENQTVEFRCADGSANIYLLLAGLTVAARHGIEWKNALELTKNLYFKGENKKIKTLKRLPCSCWESADYLLKDRTIYEKYSVFPQELIDGIVKRLKSFKDKNLKKRIRGKNTRIKKLVEKFLYC